MTGEGDALAVGDGATAAAFTERKEKANAALQVCSTKFNTLMKAHRESKK